MPIRYKGDIMKALKERGYSSTYLRRNGIFGEKIMSDFRHNEIFPHNALERLCKLLDCQPGDVLEYVKDEPDAPQGDSGSDSED